jgi:hypothetical protein
MLLMAHLLRLLPANAYGLLAPSLGPALRFASLSHRFHIPVDYMRRATNTVNYSRELPFAQGIRFDLG